MSTCSCSLSGTSACRSCINNPDTDFTITTEVDKVERSTEINRDEVVKKLRNMVGAYSATGNHNLATLFRDAADLIEDRKKGKWIEMDSCMTVCSECYGLGCETPYCPNCGAKMKMGEYE